MLGYNKAVVSHWIRVRAHDIGISETMFNIFKHSIRNPTSAPLCSISQLCSSTKAAPGQRVSIPRKTARLRLYNGTEAKAHASYTVWGNVPKCFLPMWNCTMDGFYKVNRESQLVSFDPSKVQTAFIRATHSAAPGYASPCKGRWSFASRLGSARAQPSTSVVEYTILVQGEGIITWAEIVRWWPVDRLEGFQKPSSPVLDLSILGVKSMCSIHFHPILPTLIQKKCAMVRPGGPHCRAVPRRQSKARYHLTSLHIHVCAMVKLHDGHLMKWGIS